MFPIPIDRDAVIQAVAKQHGILLSDDDPILTFLAVHDVLLNEYSEHMTEAIERVLDRHRDRSRQLAESLIGETAAKIGYEGRIIQAGIHSMLEAEHRRIQEFHDRTERFHKGSNSAMWVAVTAALISAMAVFLVLILA